MKPRILLVDDEAAIRIALKTILEGHGFEVEVAASATEATQKLGEGQFHLIITDLRMETPGAGYEVIRAAREQQYNPAVVILTAYTLHVATSIYAPVDYYKAADRVIHFRSHVLQLDGEPINDIVDNDHADGTLNTIHQLIGDLISALVAVLVCLALLLKFEEMHYRFAMERAGIVAELNHHVRNAVFPLCLAVQRLGDAESNRIANEAVERINIALKDAAADAFARKVDYGEQITSFTTEKAA